jgi:alpha-beta hydrolase superfamily lysophospholipase
VESLAANPSAGGASSKASDGATEAGSLRRTESHFHGHRGLTLFRRSWHPREPTRTVALVHGFGEHSGRYEHVGSWFARRGVTVHSFDLRGHGRSGGKRGHVDSFADYLNDLEFFLQTVSEEASPQPITLVGHSLGGLIVTALAVERSPDVQSVVTSGAALALSPDLSGLKISIARLLCKIFPRMSMNAGLAPDLICTDREVVARYVDDPLVHGTSSAAHAVSMIDQVGRLRGMGARVDVPMLLLHGALDQLCMPVGSQSFYASMPNSAGSSGAPKAELRMYPRSSHEIFNDVEQESVFADVLAWIEQHEQAVEKI